MIKFKKRKYFELEKQWSSWTPPVLCPGPTGGSQHPPTPTPHPRRPTVFLKSLFPNFVWIHHWKFLASFCKSCRKGSGSMIVFITTAQRWAGSEHRLWVGSNPASRVWDDENFMAGHMSRLETRLSTLLLCNHFTKLTDE